jgi:hypothetical protein
MLRCRLFLEAHGSLIVTSRPSLAPAHEPTRPCEAWTGGHAGMGSQSCGAQVAEPLATGFGRSSAAARSNRAVSPSHGGEDRGGALPEGDPSVSRQ